jgi:hypothetical protein
LVAAPSLLPVCGSGLAVVGSADDWELVAGPTAAVVVGAVELVVDPVVVVGPVVVLLPVVVVGAVVVVDAAVVVVVAAVVVVVDGRGSCEAHVWLRLNCASLPRLAAALRSRPILAVPPCSVSSVEVTT